MRNAILVLAVTISTLMSAQTTFEGVVQVDSNVTKDELFNRAMEWIATTYNSANNVIQMQDKEGGQIVVKATTAFDTRFKTGLFHHALGYIDYTLKIYVKEGRYKYVYTSFRHKGKKYVSEYGTHTISFGLIRDDAAPTDIGVGYGKKYKQRGWEAIHLQLNSEVLGWSNSLASAMDKPTESSNKDW